MQRHESGDGAVRHGAGGPRREFRHGFRPARFVAGLCVLTAALLYGGDAGGAWHTPWWVAFPVVVGGFVLAGVVAAVHYGVRRRAAISASRENRGAPASTSGSQAIR
ncbi:hypothetical protein ACH46N_20960 [Streptomyces pristinaespiralis]|uniref:Predicted protein n=2 Tax=Streptomyces pristinaespiralis TaxID=38300 RepID=D6X7Q0_STRE2|nr:hypothetical protein [Streptomyces pristinaespiralis]ALC21407.1 hypothetical protein SPRI_3101 [Streptomyces pristinaespiralis]EFH31168.1 predicted protein [Streptomyces pristinaespiralis ATCC 25486]